MNRLALLLFDDLYDKQQDSGELRSYLHIASLLYRIGASIHYYDYAKHTYYLICNSMLNGLSHREILICAFIASFKPKKKARQSFQLHKDILRPSDLDHIILLGAILRLAIALDRSETQPVVELSANKVKKDLQIRWTCKHDASIERKEVESFSKHFKKSWNLRVQLIDGH